MFDKVFGHVSCLEWKTENPHYQELARDTTLHKFQVLRNFTFPLDFDILWVDDGH